MAPKTILEALGQFSDALSKNHAGGIIILLVIVVGFLTAGADYVATTAHYYITQIAYVLTGTLPEDPVSQRYRSHRDQEPSRHAP